MNRQSFQVIIFLIVAFSMSVAKTDVFADKNKKRGELEKGLSRLPTAEQLKQNRQERLMHQKLEPLSERLRQAGQAKFERDKMEESKGKSRPKSLESKNFKVRQQIQRYSKWQRFAQPGKLTKNMDGRVKRSAGIQPSVLINGASSDTVDAGESFTFSITFTSGEDSALVDLFYDADGDGTVDDGEISLFNLSFGGDSEGGGPGGPGASFWIYDNSGADDDPTDGVFVETITFFPFMGISTIFQVTDGGGTGEAVLTVNNLTGDYTASGTVSPLTGPGLVTFEYWGAEGDRHFMTFTDSDGKFEFGTFDLDGYSNMWATDAALGIETGSYLEHERWFDNPGALEGITFDITRDAEASGTVLNTEDGSGIEGVWVEAQLWKGNESLFSYTMTNADGEFTLPLQGGNLYNSVFVDHPDYKSDWVGCIDNPFYVQSGDEMEVACELTPWPAFVEGRVTDAKTENPLPDIEVDISVTGTESGEYAWNMAWTDYDGYYRLGSIYGEGSLWAYDWEHREHQNAEIPSFVVDAPLVTQDIEMAPYDGAITGAITDSETGNPISVAWVNAQSDDYQNYGWGQSDGDGNYTISVMNGTYQVCADKWNEAYYTSCIENVTVSNNTVTADIALDPPDGFINGYVKNADTDEPIAGISLQASGDYWFNVDTDADGFFKMGVNNGTYQVCIYDWTNTYQTDNICFHNISVSDDTYTLATIYLSPASWDGAITGSVADQYGNAVMASIQAVDTLSWNYRYTQTDGNGEYLLPVDNGEYVVQEYPYQYGYLMNVEMGVEVNSDTVTVDFLSQVIERDAVLKGTVTDGSSNPMEGVYINVNAMGGRFEWGPYFWGETDADGHYEIDVMGFDDRYYWVYANYYNNETYESWTSGQDSVSVQSSDTVEVNLQIGPIVYSSNISGYVTMEGEPLEWAYLEAWNRQLESYFHSYSDAEGSYSMEVPNGDYDVCVWMSDQEECRGISVWDESVTVNIDFAPPGIFVPNLHGNFRFTWNSHGEMTLWDWLEDTDEDIPSGSNGEWPAESGTHYLSDGGLFVMGHDGEDMLLGGIGGEEGGWRPGSWGITVHAEDDFEFVSRYMIDQTTGLSAKEIIATKDGEDMVLIGTNLKHDGPDSLKSVRVGYGLDWDVAYSKDGDLLYTDDDLSGSLSINLIDPIYASTIPVKVSYMYDADGSSPGYVGAATVFETEIGAGTHLSFDLDEEDDEFVERLQSDTDSPDETDPSDYAVIQMSGAVDLGPGDEMNFITVLMAADYTEDFQAMLQSSLTYVALAGLGEFSAAVDEPVLLPEEYALHQNHPNPFNPVTTIRYDLPQAGDVKLTIYDMLGREMKVLVSQQGMSPGSHTVVWDGTDRLGQPAAAGVYIYQLKSGDFINTKKLVLLK